MDAPTLFTIGHSNHPLASFLRLLGQHGIEAIADVRSMPYSRYVPHFNPAALRSALTEAGIAYVYLGQELGARPDDPTCFVDGRVSYERLAARPAYQAGLARVEQGVLKYRLALMCTEKDPLDCHRMVLLCRHLRRSYPRIAHILADGSLEPNEAAEVRLCARLDLRPTLFDSQADIIERAYERQGRRIAFRQEQSAGADERPDGDGDQ